MRIRKRLAAAALAVLLAVAAVPCAVMAEKKEEMLTKVTLNEVAHSVFYAPQYVALEKGYFREEGLDVELVTGFGADKVLTALISGEADIGFMGAEASVYAFQEGATDPAVNFAQLTQRAGNFLVARVVADGLHSLQVEALHVHERLKATLVEHVYQVPRNAAQAEAAVDVFLEHNVL